MSRYLTHNDRSCHLSESQPVRSTKKTPIAPLGVSKISARSEEKPKVVNRMLEKSEIPPFEMEERSVAGQIK